MFWVSLILQVWMVDSFFHEASMKTFEAKESVANNALFGYSISYESSNKRLIAGAPKGDVMGQVYTIEIGSESTQRIKFEYLEANLRFANKTRTQSWLGTSVAASDDFFVTCAPRYTEDKKIRYHRNDKRFVNYGVCGIEDKNSSLTFLKPMTTKDRQRNATELIERAMDNFGWSIKVMKPDGIVLIGGPSQIAGRVIVYEQAKKYPNKPPILINKNILLNDPVRFNFGYSITYGNFFGDKSVEYAVSTTYGDVGFPKVYIFNSKYAHINTLVHDEIGTLFGGCLCTVRLSADYDSLLIGAPLYARTAYESDTGAVYVFQPNSDTSPTFTLKKIIKAKTPGGHFGLSIANLGDMDGDGRDEVAIAAPYENDGAVYIYTGKALVSEPEKYMMKIKPEGFQTFGLSLATLWDYDDNGSNGLAIGAPESNKIAILRSFASVTVNLRTEFPILQFDSHKSDENISFKVILSVVYPKKAKNVTADIKVTAELTDGKSKFVNNPEMGIYTYTQSLNDKLSSYNHSIPVKVVIPRKDVFQVISYKITVELMEDPMKIPFDPSRVLLSESSTLFEQDTKTSSRCTGARCMPNLEPTLTTSLMDKYIIGSTEREYFNISVFNSGDNAYAPCIKVEARGVRILKASKDCVLGLNEEFICSPTIAVLKGHTWNIPNMEMEMNTLKSEDYNIFIKYDLYSHCDDTTDRKTFENPIKLYPDLNFEIKGQSNPSDIINTTVNELKDFQKQIKHVYTITNDGVTNWVDLQFQISFNHSDHINVFNSSALVYPESGAIQCAMKNVSEVIFACTFSLNRKQKAQIHISIELLKDSFGTDDEDSTAEIVTNLYLVNFAKYNVASDTFLSLSTSLHISSTRVALWIIILSSLLGLLLLIIIAFIMYKCGFFRRNNREKLEGLKESVHRQSVYRKSMRASMLAAAKSNAEENSELILNDEDLQSE
ncbi:integrin alpha-5 [Pieris rapae]|uniref:integrin alpha-5 n=1 Tax=Pieris rapae TaxID=64459 RepID=UPI001E27D231|nr:integrin alpha-5 [Pieris rapae]